MLPAVPRSDHSRFLPCVRRVGRRGRKCWRALPVSIRYAAMGLPMTSERVTLAWREAAVDLGVDVVAPFEIALQGGTSERFAVLVRHFGCPLGTLIDSELTDGDTFWKRSAICDAAGYCYSQLNPEAYNTYDRSTFIETLVDWGWAEANTAPPRWYAEAVEKKA